MSAAYAHGSSILTASLFCYCGFGHALNCRSNKKIWYHGGRTKGRYRPWLTIGYDMMYVTNAVHPQSISMEPNQRVNAFLRYQGRWCLDGRRLVDLGLEFELLTSLLKVGSSRMCCETPFGVFKQMRVKLTFYHLVELANPFFELKNWWHTLTARLMVCSYLNKHAGNPSADRKS